jgi:hypothetical protein
MIARLRTLAVRIGLTLIGVISPVSVVHAQAASGQTDTASWLTSDSAAKTVSLRLETSRPGGSPAALINGLSGSNAQVTVPLGWTVQWEWRSADSSAPHSLVVMAEREKLPTEGGRPAFDNALTRQLQEGLPAGQVDRTTFLADQAGWYWILCGVPGHAIAGEYIGLRVDPAATAGAVRRK